MDISALYFPPYVCTYPGVQSTLDEIEINGRGDSPSALTLNDAALIETVHAAETYLVHANLVHSSRGHLFRAPILCPLISLAKLLSRNYLVRKSLSRLSRAALILTLCALISLTLNLVRTHLVRLSCLCALIS